MTFDKALESHKKKISERKQTKENMLDMSQFEILRKWATVMKLDFRDASELNGSILRLHFYEGVNQYLSVIYGNGTYGSNWGLLEIQGLLTEEELKNDSVVGYLTALEICTRIDKHLRDKNE